MFCFEFHHAKKGIVVLYRWLPSDEKINLPVYAHTMLGVGGMVVNEKNEILVVSERFALIPGSWKLPGGYVDPKEDIVDAAIREVREETGIETEFNTMVCLRHIHNGTFGCSDLYAVVSLIPKSQKLNLDNQEILKAEWMPIQKYLNHPYVHETNRKFVQCYFDYQKSGIRLTCEKRFHQVLKKTYSLYYLQSIEEKSKMQRNQDELNQIK